VTRALLAVFLALLLGCAGTVTSADATSEDAPGLDDIARDAEAADEPPGVDAAMDRPEPPPAEVGVDVVDAPDRFVAEVVDADATVDRAGDAMTCPEDPPTGPPSESRRSCAPGQAPTWHCREVHHCGGTFTMGSRQAWEIDVNVLDLTKGYVLRTFPMRTCDLHTAVVQPGYVDAYEVTVARFRAWVNAGMPHPARDAVVFGERRWLTEYNSDMILPDRATAVSEQPGVPVTSPFNVSSTGSASDPVWRFL